MKKIYDNMLELFFSQEFEKKIDQKMMYYDFVFPRCEVLEYIKHVNKIPINLFVEYIMSQEDFPIIKAKDVMQFSNFDDATMRLCNELIQINNPGIEALDAGKILLNDGKSRNKVAYIKYGENHMKTAESLGLVCEVCHTYYVNTIGYVINDLDLDEKNKLLTRLVLRNRLVKRLIHATSNGNVVCRELLYMLSESTYNRRRSNVKRVLSVLSSSKEYDFTKILKKIIL